MTPGTAYELCIDLQATAVTFLPGHCIRVDVTSSSHPRWIRHTNTASNPLDATELVVASQQILHDPQHPSRIHLTVVPEDSDARLQRAVSQPTTTSPIMARRWSRFSGAVKSRPNR